MGRASRRKRVAVDTVMSMPSHAAIRSQQRYERTAPCCGQIICPMLRAYYIKRNAFHQYRCESCGTWLTFESDTKLEAAALSFLYLLVTILPVLTAISRLFHDTNVRFGMMAATVAIVFISWYWLLGRVNTIGVRSYT